MLHRSSLEALVYEHFMTLRYALNKYVCHIAHIYAPLHFYYSLQIDTHITAHINQNQLIATYINQTVAQYMPTTDMPLKCQKYSIYPNYLTSINGGGMQIYMPHMKLLWLIISPELLYTDDDKDAGKQWCHHSPITNSELATWPN